MPQTHSAVQQKNSTKGRAKLSPESQAVLQKVYKVFDKLKIFPEGTRLGVAVSGGPDSTALVRLLHLLQPQLQYELHVLHFDHRLQEVSKHHARFVAELCLRLGLPFHMGRWGDSREFSKRDGEVCKTVGKVGQALARKARRNFFKKKALELALEFVATGHTADDQAETVLWRVLRGAAPSSLAGIHQRKDFEGLSFIRPVLEIRRNELKGVLRDLNENYCVDPSNLKSQYLRNRIRHDLLPEISKNYNPAVQKHLCQLAEISGREAAFLDEILQDWLNQNLPNIGLPKPRKHRKGKKAASRTRAKLPIFKRQALQQCPEALRYRLYLRILGSLVGLDLGQVKLIHLQNMENLIHRKEPGILALPDGWSLIITSLADGATVNLVRKSHHS